MDLGVLMAQQHRGLLTASWAIITLPLFCLLSLLLWDYPTVAVLLFWWLKPVYERLPLLILSRALFGPPPSIKEAIAEWLKILRPNLLSSLTWRRLSLSRSFILPVIQLEQLRGPELNARIGLLSQKQHFAARGLTAIGGALEVSLWVGMIALFYALIPQQVEIDWVWLTMADVNNELNWLEHLTNLFYVLILTIWGPIYVSCGFSLYLNRRTILEGWDIELAFRRLRQRLMGSAYLLLIGGLGLSLVSAAGSVWAADQSYSCPVPVSEPQGEPGPDSPRLIHQKLTSVAAQEGIRNLLQQPPFKNPKVISGWRFPDEPEEPKTAKNANTASFMYDWLNWLLTFSNFLAQVFKVLLWALLIASAGMFVWHYRRWLKAFVGHAPQLGKPPRSEPGQLPGLQVSAESLPEDVAGSAERLWASRPREALGLLYRALLSRLLVDHHLPLASADTEGQILQKIEALDEPTLQLYARSLTQHWQSLAYGHQVPSIEVQQALCSGWRNLFDRNEER
jgi:hypothetical protein